VAGVIATAAMPAAKRRREILGIIVILRAMTR
jgi:hypothetical protein